MPNYQVSEAKLHQLNVIVGEQGGTIPSEVSNALAGVQVALSQGDTALANNYLNQAITANQKNGAAWSNVQAWHDAVKASGTGGGGGDPTPPTEPPYAHHTYVEPGTGGTLLIETQWGNDGRIESEANGGFPPDGAVVVHFKTPSKLPTNVTEGWVQTAEFGGMPVNRQITLSTEPGHFQGPAVLAASYAGNQPQIMFPQLKANTDYYVNVCNYIPGGEPLNNSCTLGYQCNLLVQFHWPAKT